MRFRIILAIILIALLAFVAQGFAAKPKKAEAKGPQPAVLAADYVGSAACKMCHLAEYQSREKELSTNMVLKKAVGIIKDALQKWASDGTNPGPAKGNITGRKLTLDDVEYVIGTKWKQRYMTKNPAGGFEFLDKQFNAVSGKWEGYGNKNDWGTTCATCHTTGYRLQSYDPASPQTAKYAYTELGVGCEACHGPGSRHIVSRSAKDVWNPARQPKDAQSRACGYCHIRLENDKFKTAQGNKSEQFPAPKVGDSQKPGDNWHGWYPEGVMIPGVQANRPASGSYEGDLKGMFKVDDISKANGVYEEAKHHQQYQGLIQSSHYRKNVLSCNDCHSSHAVKGKTAIVPRDVCVKCHGNLYDVDKIMPGTGRTADDLFVRTHTFIKNQGRPAGRTAPYDFAPPLGMTK